MDFEIEPTDEKPTDKRGRPAFYPFEEMEVDYSFFVEKKHSSQMSPICAFWNKKKLIAKLDDDGEPVFKRFIARHTDNDGKRIIKRGIPGCRVYRVI